MTMFIPTAGYAGFWKRFAAAIIDGLILAVPGIILGTLIGRDFAARFYDPKTAVIATEFIGQLVGICMVWLYYSAMESSPWQATLGKKALGIVVVDSNGRRITWGRATGRHLGKLISAILFGLGFLFAAFTSKKQALHDLMAGTFVVNKPKSGMPATSSAPKGEVRAVEKAGNGSTILAIALAGVVVLLAIMLFRKETTPCRPPSTNFRPTPDYHAESQPAASGMTKSSGWRIPDLGMEFLQVPGTYVLFSKWETRVQDFQAFVKATGNECGGEWHKPSFEQGPTHPVLNVSWDDAQAFCKWLTDRERNAGRLGANQQYRLPTDEEWSVAVGLPQESGRTPKDRDRGIKDVYLWGVYWPPRQGDGNYGVIKGYDDGYACTSPAGSFKANMFGLYDLGGNVWEWCEDYYEGKSGARVLRGGAWVNRGPKSLLSSYRFSDVPESRNFYNGFRSVLASSSF